MIEQIVEYNKKFVENKGYEPYLTSKYPNKKLAVLTCMDTRLTELLPAALGLKNGDAKIIKNAGGVITHPYGSVVRSLLVAILELGVEQVMVIGHTDCGVQGMDGNELLASKAGFTSQELNDMLNGRRIMRAADIASLISVVKDFGVDANYLFGIEKGE